MASGLFWNALSLKGDTNQAFMIYNFASIPTKNSFTVKVHNDTLSFLSFDKKNN